MSEKSLDQLVKASVRAAQGQLQHILVVLTPDGRIRLNGTDNLVNALNQDRELLERVDNFITNNKNEEGEVGALALLDYPLLPCSPYSAGWKGVGSKKKRGILSKMLVRAGYGRAGTKKNLGVGVPPIGWPDQVIPWENFKGPSRSGLSVNQVTNIIVHLLLGANLNPQTHVLPQPPQEQVEAEQGEHEQVGVEHDEHEEENHTGDESITEDSADDNEVPEAANEEIVEQNVAVENIAEDSDTFQDLQAVFNNNIDEIVRIEPVDTATAVTDEKNNIIVIDNIEDFVRDYGIHEHDYFDKKRKHGSV